MNKALVNSKAGIEHLCEKLQDLKVDLSQDKNFEHSADDIEFLMRDAEQKVNVLFNTVKADPNYSEYQNELFGSKKEEMNQDKGFMRQTGTSWAGKTTNNEPAANNVRVKLPDRDEEDLSDVDQDAEVSISLTLVRSRS